MGVDPCTRKPLCRCATYKLLLVLSRRPWLKPRCLFTIGYPFKCLCLRHLLFRTDTHICITSQLSHICVMCNYKTLSKTSSVVLSVTQANRETFRTPLLLSPMFTNLTPVPDSSTFSPPLTHPFRGVVLRIDYSKTGCSVSWDLVSHGERMSVSRNESLISPDPHPSVEVSS